MRHRRVLLGTIAVVALLLIAGRGGSLLYTDALWYRSVGAEQLWRLRLQTGAALVIGSWFVATVFAFVNIFAVRMSVVSLVLPRRIGNLEIGEEVPSRYLLLAALALAAVVGAVLTLDPADWSTALLPRIGRPFAETEPYFGEDLGFFVYWLPFENALHRWASLGTAVVSAVVLLLYALTPSLRWERGALRMSGYVRRHIMMLGAVVLLLLAWGERLRMYRLLSAGTGPAGVFTSMDHRVAVPATLLLSVITFGAALVVGWSAWMGQRRVAFAAVTAVMLLSLAARTVAPLVARRATDPALIAAGERPYLATRLGFTRRAFAVDRIEAESLGTGYADAAEAAAFVSLWDGPTLSRATERLRRTRVVGERPAWMVGSGRLLAAAVERGGDPGDPRELWGVVRVDATTVDERGLPLRVGSARPGLETLPAEPAVYDSAPAYSVLPDSLGLRSGIELTSTLSRLAHAWSLQNFRLLFGDLPAERPMIVRRRSVRERVEALAPFFTQGSEVVPVLADDSLYWALELYAVSETYPLSQRFTVLGADRSYVHHAATALVEALSGRTRLVGSATPDPITASWAATLPGLFVPLTSLTPALQRALPPHTDGARAQAVAFAATGFRGDSLEVRHLATLDGGDSLAARESQVAFVPPLGGVARWWPLLDGADRLRGLVAAVGGPHPSTAWLPVPAGPHAWSGVLDRLRAADTTARESGVQRAPLRAVIVGGRALYFQPVYRLHAGGGATLERVVALQGDSVRVGRTLGESLGTRTGSPVTLPAAAGDLPGLLRPLYRAMREALRRGDWSTFGRAFDSLGVLLPREP